MGALVAGARIDFHAIFLISQPIPGLAQALAQT
jgi:hypothetical protein